MLKKTLELLIDLLTLAFLAVSLALVGIVLLLLIRCAGLHL